ncbi:MAG: response regulator [Treponema sp.]|nr:response regulator [Treponema sp.]
MGAREEELLAELAQRDKNEKKTRREIQHLQRAVDLEKLIVEAKANQEAVRTFAQKERDKYLRLLLVSSPNTILLLDKTGRIAYCTDVFLQRAGFSDHTEVRGYTLKEVLYKCAEEEWAEKIDGVLRQAVDTGRPLKYEASFDIGNSGYLHNYILHFSPMVNDDGGHEGVMVLFHDVTAIEKARKEAEQASLAKSVFLSNMSHEMRTPMNAIIGMTAIGKAAGGIERKDYAFGKIEDASTHLLGVINDILDMSKIEANKLELSPDLFGFEKMLQKVINVINFRVEEKHQNFTVHIDRQIPRSFVGDDQRLAQVITNLLSNAVKFTPEQGSVRLDTHFIKEDDGLCTIQIEVTDTGIGINEEQKARLFTPFQQAEDSTSRKFGGTGLGLAISRRIVEMMGGKIWIESELGRGSTFAFTVQMKRGTEEPCSLLSPEVNWKNIRLLAVDDAPEILEYFAEIARGLGVLCDTALSGEEAVRLIERNGAYDICFVDWKMPGMDGIELSRRIKKQGMGNSVVIMISATEWSVIEDDAKRAGVDKFLQKPLFPSALVDCINECMGAGPLIEEGGREQTDDFSGYRILMAEDVEINREIVTALLEPTKLAIDCAVNGVETVSMFSAAPSAYDMIFMDVQMPEMDGYEATRRIRAWEAEQRAPGENREVPEGAREFPEETPGEPPRQIPIVAMTANVFREDIEKCLAAGMNDHVGKPLDFNEVLEKLRKYLPKR